MVMYAFRGKFCSSSGRVALSIRQRLSFVLEYASIQIMYAFRLSVLAIEVALFFRVHQ